MLNFGYFCFLRWLFHLMPLKSLNHTFFLLPNIYLNIPCLNTPLRCEKCLKERKKRKSGKRKKAGKRKKRKSGKRKRNGKLSAAKAGNKAYSPF